MDKGGFVKKSNRNMLIVIVALVAIVVIACLSFMFINAAIENQASNEVDTSESLYNSYHQIGNDELSALLAGTDSAYVYVGRDTCPHCATFSPILLEVIQENDKLVYYYNTDNARSQDAARMSELLNSIDISGVPALIKIENGIKVAQLQDYGSKDAIVFFLEQ